MNNTNTQNQQLSTFSFNSNALRVVELEGEPWFITKDVCQALGLKQNTSGSYTHQLLNISKEEKQVISKGCSLNLHTLFSGQITRLSIISESGLYALTMRARRRNPSISKFQDWVTQEVLPSIRKTGAYVMGQEPVKDTGSIDLMRQCILLIIKGIFSNTYEYNRTFCVGL